ncbi:unnamed protein product [Acanthoscelides obtectus]|uniref:Uncharacterized protein n=1 Tax=Acanthoscelides obtectus TaxID=200917 RepID=A0A9P0LF74_ACAOB|nr:unnamed protein product [Acanthoscelides obtectus]CAK1651827.1 hypothetical protein AOBTE_LOCUS17482 [Acanthoscelides obtectus]
MWSAMKHSRSRVEGTLSHCQPMVIKYRENIDHLLLFSLQGIHLDNWVLQDHG